MWFRFCTVKNSEMPKKKYSLKPFSESFCKIEHRLILIELFLAKILQFKEKGRKESLVIRPNHNDQIEKCNN
jgi:hypothetical protein